MTRLPETQYLEPICTKTECLPLLVTMQSCIQSSTYQVFRYFWTPKSPPMSSYWSIFGQCVGWCFLSVSSVASWFSHIPRERHDTVPAANLHETPHHYRVAVTILPMLSKKSVTFMYMWSSSSVLEFLTSLSVSTESDSCLTSAISVLDCWSNSHQ